MKWPNVLYTNTRDIKFNMTQFTELKCKVQNQGKVKHHLFLRQHIVREVAPEKPRERTLFVAGVPPFFDERVLKQLFNAFGNVSAVYIHKNPSPKAPPLKESKYFRVEPQIVGFKVAYIVFEKEKSVETALKNEKIIILPDVCHTGYDKWVKNYNDNIVAPEDLSSEIEEYMLKFDEAKEERDILEKSMEGKDDDGWVTVGKKGKRPGFSRKESVQNHIDKTEEKKRKKKEHTNFYRFQIKESKMKNLVALRQKFEEDKKKIAALKATRRFRPF